MKKLLRLEETTIENILKNYSKEFMARYIVEIDKTYNLLIDKVNESEEKKSTVIKEINTILEIIKKQPTRNDEWIINRLLGIKNIIEKSDK